MAAVSDDAPPVQVPELDALRLLAALHARLLAASSIAEIAGATLALVEDGCGALGVALYLANPDGTHLLEAWSGSASALQAAPLERHLDGPRLADKLPALVLETAFLETADAPAEIDAVLRAEGIVPLVRPLRVHERRIGVLVVCWGAERTLTESEHLLLEVAAGQVALALDRVASEPHRDHESRARLAAIVESSQDAIVGKDLNSIITSWNPGAEQLYGYTAAEAIGQAIALLFPSGRPNELSSIMERLRSGERIQHFETTRVRKDGAQIEVSVSISPIRDAQGRIVGAAGIGRDITARLTSEREHHDLLVRERASREQLDAILGGVADGVMVQAEDGTFVYANDAAARLAGFENAETYLGTSTFEISQRLAVLDAEGQPFPYDQLPARRAFRGEPAPEMVVQFKRLDTGEARWSRTQARIIRGADGERLAISIFHDITDEIRARERLRFLAEAGAQLAGSLDIDETLAALVRVASRTLADWAVVLLIDEDGAVQHIASAHRDPEKERLSGDLHERQLRHASGAALLWQAIQAGETLLVSEVTDEMLVRTARNAEHLDLLRAFGLSSLLYAPLIGSGRVLGAIALFMSETGRRFGEEDRAIAVEIARRASLALENARLYRQTQEAVQMRDEFLSIASHELRTPVTAISGVAQMALRAQRAGKLSMDRLGIVLERIMRSSQRLVTMTEDLLDVSRLQAGRFALRLETLDLQVFLADLVDRYGGHLEEQYVLTLEASGEGLTIQADAARLEQVLANLLSNAVKYTPDGGVIVVSVQPDDGGVRISVRDRGIGLPAGMEETIFQPFGRAPNATHRQIQGLGLGLYICRQVMDRHGGRIWAESAGDGEGTTMQLWLPPSPPADADPPVDTR